MRVVRIGSGTPLSVIGKLYRCYQTPKYSLQISLKWREASVRMRKGALPALYLLCHHCTYFATTVRTLQPLYLLCNHRTYFASTVPTVSPLCVLCHNCTYFATTVPTLPPLYLLCHHSTYFATTVRTLPSLYLTTFLARYT